MSQQSPAEAEFPVKTADELVLPDGQRVWIKTLNDTLRGEAIEDADLFATAATLRFRKGNKDLDIDDGADYASVIAQVSDQSPQDQAAYLAATDYQVGDMRQQAEDAHPDPERPQRADLDDVKFAAAVRKFEKAKTEAAKARKAKEDELWKAAVAEALALTPRERLQKCGEAFARRKQREVFAKQFAYELILRCVRAHDDHLRRHYQSIDEVRDLPDPVRDAIISFYYKLDTVAQSQVPTSPAGSSG